MVDNVPKRNLHIDDSSCVSSLKQSSCDSTLLDFSCISTSTEFSYDSECSNFDYEKVKITKTRNRKSRKRSFLSMFIEEEEDIPSAYELQREKKIQENLQLLK